MNDTCFAGVRACFVEAQASHAEAERRLVGKSVRIISDYNDQPFGRSKPSLKGKVCEVVHVHFDMQWGISVKLKDRRLYIKLDELEPA